MATIDLPQRVADFSPPSDTAATTAAEDPRRIPFKFSGTGGEYFRIWIVNILLSIVTLGIYSAWAKVRNKKYFYGSTTLDGSSFEYTANPISILKGRILVVAALILYQVVAIYAPLLAGVMAIGLIFLFPWIINQALAFNARFSSYRNLRFHFDGKYPESFRYYILWTVLSVLSLGLAYPYTVYLRKGFMVGRSRFGESTFRFSGKPRYFYMVYIIAALVFVGLIIAMSVLVGGLAALGAMLGGAEGGAGGGVPPLAAILVTVLAQVLMFAVILGAAIMVQTVITNHVLQSTSLKGLQLHMEMNPWRVFWIQLSNAVMIVLSVGLLIPWARVRIIRYRLSCLSLTASQPLESFVASEKERITATGQEMGDMLDLDLGL